MARSPPAASAAMAGAFVPLGASPPRAPMLLTPAAARALRHRMLLLRQAATTRIARLTDRPEADIRRFHRELVESALPDMLVQRGAHASFARELPQAGLLYLIARALRPTRIVETGVRPGYSTAWLLAALEANGEGELLSLGPGSVEGRAAGVGDASVGQLVAPALRGRWTLVLGNTEERLQEILDATPVDLFFYDNGPDVDRARFELRNAWAALSPRGLVLSHRVDANPAWADFCRGQGLPPQILDPGPPPLGALAMRR